MGTNFHVLRKLNVVQCRRQQKTPVGWCCVLSLFAHSSSPVSWKCIIRLRESGGLNTGKQVSLLLSTAGLKNSLLQWSQNSWWLSDTRCSIMWKRLLSLICWLTLIVTHILKHLECKTPNIHKVTTKCFAYNMLKHDSKEIQPPQSLRWDLIYLKSWFLTKVGHGICDLWCLIIDLNSDETVFACLLSHLHLTVLNPLSEW